MGPEGLAETKRILSENNIDFAGAPHSCTQDYTKERRDVVFAVFNKTFSFNCSNNVISRLIAQTRAEHPGKFLIAVLHWGKEYQPKSSKSQKDLAHKAIKAGADLVVGSHPHVVQEVEKYQDKLIFYSLGNFIFDQYFSEATQQGLALKIELTSQKVIYNLLPIESQKSQPFLMAPEKRTDFLKNLAVKSVPQTESFVREIESSKIIVKR